MDPRRACGTTGERLAEAALERHGIRTVERNARTRWGEIDLVCRDRDGYVFIEVKTRHPSSFVGAAEAVDRRKLVRLERLALAWLARHGLQQVPWRLAVVAVTLQREGARVELLAVDRV